MNKLNSMHFVDTADLSVVVYEHLVRAYVPVGLFFKIDDDDTAAISN